MISFLSCVLSLQAAASRLIYSYGRDRMIFASGLFGRFNDRLGIPPGAMTVALVVPAVIVLISKVSEDALTKMIALAVAGIYLGFQLVVFAALRTRLRGWRLAGKWSLGRWGLLVNVAALTYGVLALINIVWPRTPDVPWYDNYIVLLGIAVVVGTGLMYMLLGRPEQRSDAPEADAIEIAERIRAADGSELSSGARG